MSFQTRARINRPAYIVRSQIIDRTREACKAGGPWVEPEIDESPLQRHERTNRPMAGHDLWTNEPMQNFEIAVPEGDGSAARIREALGESLLEVVAHLSFEHHMREHLDGGAPSQSRHVGFCLREAEVISISANLKMILRRRQRHQPSCQK